MTSIFVTDVTISTYYRTEPCGYHFKPLHPIVLWHFYKICQTQSRILRYSTVNPSPTHCLLWDSNWLFGNLPSDESHWTLLNNRSGMAWCWQAINLNQCWPRAMSPYSVTLPQLVDMISLIWHPQRVYKKKLTENWTFQIIGQNRNIWWCMQICTCSAHEDAI